MGTILLVDDDHDLRTIIADVLREEGFIVREAEDGPGAVRKFKGEPPDAVILDLNMPYMDGMETMREFMKIDPGVPVIILTAFGDIPTAVDAIRSGAYDFTVKPPEFEKLVITLKRAVEKRALENEVRRANATLDKSLENLLGKSGAMRPVIEKIRKVAQTDLSVLVQGETGTGKSVVATAIHDFSMRAAEVFVSVDIGLFPEHLIESELFGYRKGAFTGADRDKAGYFESAHRGTLFIDELENLSPGIQGKLLTFIERKKIYPLGYTTAVDADVRIIAATNREIQESVMKKEFREDLYYRLAEFVITIPPLRERKEDIFFFANKFMSDASLELNRQMREITDDARDMLHSYGWPGNLRELKNVMKKAVLLAPTDRITGSCIESVMNPEGDSRDCGAATLSLKEALQEEEKRLIRGALMQAGWNKTRASAMLGISYAGLLAKIREYQIK